jgi:diketogulonate reductase-like aldo/keto reductase
MWALQRGTSVVPKSVHPSRIRANLDLDGWELNNEEMMTLSQLGLSFKTCRDEWLPGKVFFDEDA